MKGRGVSGCVSKEDTAFHPTFMYGHSAAPFAAASSRTYFTVASPRTTTPGHLLPPVTPKAPAPALALALSESLAPGPADALSADPAISAPWAPVYSCLAGGGASSVVGDAGCSRGASAPGPPAGSCAGMMPDSCLRALKRLVYPRRRRRRVRVDGGGVLSITVFTLI